MVSNMISRAAVLLAASASIASAGNVIVQNQCNFDAYLWSVSNVAGPMQTLAANGGDYTETYRSNPDGGGISMKLATNEAASNITQFEYTLETPTLWYDLSNINGYPFMAWGVSVVPSESTCNEVICPAGVALCADAYNTPTEDYATAACTSDADVVVLLCSGAKDTTPGNSASSSYSSVLASATSALSTETTSSTSSVAPTTTFATSTKDAAPTASASSTTSITTTTPTTLATSTTDNGVVIQTTFVTAVVTVVAGESSTAAPSTTTTEQSHHTWTRPSFTGFPKERRHAREHIHRHGH